MNKTLRIGATLALGSMVAAAGSARAASIDISMNSTDQTHYVGTSGSTATAGVTADPGTVWNNAYMENYTTTGTTSQIFGGGNTADSAQGAGDIAYPGKTNTSGYFYDTGGNQLSNFQIYADASFATNGGQASGAGATTNDLNLFGSGVGGSTSGTGFPIVFTLYNIPAAYVATGYSIYVYYSSGNPTHFGFVTDGTTKYYVSNDTGANSTTAFPGYVPASSTTAGTYTSSDYAKFSNENAASLTLTLEATDSSGNNTALGLSLMGFQIVQAPEPASLALLGIGSMAGLLRRRREREIAV